MMASAAINISTWLFVVALVVASCLMACFAHRIV
jgi:hypothetical protein